MSKEMKLPSYVQQIQPFAQAVAQLLHPHVEVVVHDLASDKIVIIENSISKRSVGDPADLEGFDPKSGENVIGTYKKINWDGRVLKSISAAYRDPKGRVAALICLNFDTTVLRDMQGHLAQLVSMFTLQEKPQVLFEHDLLDKINTFVHGYLQEQRKNLRALTQKDKEAVIRMLHQSGVFTELRAATYVAQVLDMSRATVYNYLKAMGLGTRERRV